MVDDLYLRPAGAKVVNFHKIKAALLSNVGEIIDNDQWLISDEPKFLDS
jgi:hypothetical protein